MSFKLFYYCYFSAKMCEKQSCDPIGSKHVFFCYPACIYYHTVFSISLYKSNRILSVFVFVPKELPIAEPICFSFTVKNLIAQDRYVIFLRWRYLYIFTRNNPLKKYNILFPFKNNKESGGSSNSPSIKCH